MKLTTHFLLVPKLRNNTAILYSLLHASNMSTGITLGTLLPISMVATPVKAMYKCCSGCLTTAYCDNSDEDEWVFLFYKGYQYSSVRDKFIIKYTSLSGRLTDLEDGVCNAPSSSFYSTDGDICLDTSFCVQQICVYCPANGMLCVCCEQPVCCLLSIRPTHVQFSQV